MPRNIATAPGEFRLNIHTTEMQLTEATCAISHRAAIVHVRISGTLARTDAPAMCRRMGQLIDSGARQLELDVGGVLAIDRACLAVLISVARRLRKAGGTLRFSAVSLECDRIFCQLHLFRAELREYHDNAVHAVA